MSEFALFQVAEFRDLHGTHIRACIRLPASMTPAQINAAIATGEYPDEAEFVCFFKEPNSDKELVYVAEDGGQVGFIGLLAIYWGIDLTAPEVQRALVRVEDPEQGLAQVAIDVERLQAEGKTLEEIVLWCDRSHEKFSTSDLLRVIGEMLNQDVFSQFQGDQRLRWTQN